MKMEKKYTLGIIGAGNMASAIVGGILNSKILDPNQIIISDLDDVKLNEKMALGLNVTKSNLEVFENAENILFAVKPQSFDDVVKDIKDKCKASLIISIMAGVSIEKLQSNFGKDKNYSRIMPNTPALVKKGMAAIAFSENFRSEFVINIFKSLGEVVELDEKYFDAVTSLSGSGPAYVYLFIKSLIDGGIQGGLDFETSKKLALQTVLGAVEMVKSSPLDIDTLISNVCSKGGTTIEAINYYKDHKFEAIVKEGMKKCKDRSEELSGKKVNSLAASLLDDKAITIFTDGACSGNPGIGGWAYVIVNNKSEDGNSGAEDNTTNNRMELLAIINALKSLDGHQVVNLYSDSAYALNAFLEGWIYNWVMNGWRSASGEVKNVDLWQELLELTKIHDVKFIKVKGHSDNVYNNLCDRLAKKAIQDFQQQI